MSDAKGDIASGLQNNEVTWAHRSLTFVDRCRVGEDDLRTGIDD